MKRPALRPLLVLMASLSFAGVAGGTACARAQPEMRPLPVLEPYKLVRSLRMLQDQVVAGKPEAVVMLNKLLGFVSTDMSRAQPEVWDKPENIYAAIIYLFNGGNPEAVRKVLANLKTDTVPQELVKGALAYASGQTIEVVKLFSVPLAPEAPAELKASIVLVTANQMMAFDPATALLRLDQVRLEAPGTLFEEAAIRRSLPIAAKLGAADKVRLLSRNYLQRFRHSPYMRDFMAQFVDTTLKLSDRIGDEELVKLIGSADPLLQYTLYLQIARGALVDGQTERARFMSAEARKLAGHLNADPTRANLYAAASDVASDSAGSALRELSQISPDHLQEPDRKLLKAAETVGAIVTRAPDTTSRAKRSADEREVPRMAVADAPQLPAQQTLSAPVEVDFNSARTRSEADLQKTMENARRKLAEIDALLGKTVE
ncbi:chemotaxis protein MotC [Brucella abortus]|uniref:Chemotaxis protein n=1 Tax=Brucella abortus TaxID=235 RepID=A0AAE9RU98_BRUAO|nr:MULTISPECIES: chemotaxis protein [Brucella]ALF30783.1 chemotaxis protein MotC [Brucella abortus 104M]ASZ87284.1 chemotaxis protein MotC [Brucella abortus]ASZ90195.1 chemotaxis protein MotC [Brucella abortus]ASZ93177.1 chemotaxis protein MotC [Brucella abortus]ASZ99041.1 chemotaxis protein MotC [Brucella abortus]